MKLMASVLRVSGYTTSFVRMRCSVSYAVFCASGVVRHQQHHCLLRGKAGDGRLCTSLCIGISRPFDGLRTEANGACPVSSSYASTPQLQQSTLFV